MSGTSAHIVPSNFTDTEFRATKARPCPVCGHDSWCLHGDGFAICQRVESVDRWKDAGWFHRLQNGKPVGGRNRNASRKLPCDVQPVPAKSANGKYLWPTPEDAAQAFEALPLVRNHVAAREFLRDQYGIPVDAAPEAWRAFEHPHMGAGSVYRGADRDGGPVFKFKAIARRAGGARKMTFLSEHGGDPWFVLEYAMDAPWVIVGGEEKAVAAWLAGYNVLCSMAGEHAPGEEWLDYFKSLDPSRVVAANDADDAGRKANRATTRALELAGVEPGRIFSVAWPDGTPDKCDLNDALKAHGAAGLRNLLDGATPHKPLLPRRFGLDDFLAVDRAPLEYHIEGFLPREGKMTFSAPSKFGKSMWAIQTGLALASGECEWLGMRFGRPARVLYLQAEIMDALLSARLAAIRATMPEQIDRARVAKNFRIQEIGEGRPNLYSEEGREVVEAVLRVERPEVLILDPLAALCPGMEENSSAEMTLALDYFTELTRRYHLAIILIHHHGKSQGGGSRGSSAFEAWPESDLSAKFVDEEGSTAKVTLRLRCAFNSGPVYWRAPTETNLWFEVVPPGQEPPEKAGRKARSKTL